MEKRPLELKDSMLTLILGLCVSLFGVAFLVVLVQTIFQLVYSHSFDITSLYNNAYKYSLVSAVMYALLVLVFLLINKNKDNQIIQRVNTKKIIIYILLAISLNLFLTPIVTVVDTFLDKLNVGSSELSFDITNKNFMVCIFSLAVLPAIVEELLFRGLIFKGLKKYGKAFSIILSAIMFSLFHMSLRQTLYPILFGLALGLVMYKENNIIYCIIMHFVNNFIALTLSYLNASFNIRMAILVIIAVVLLLIYLVLVIYLIAKNNTRSANLNKKERIYLYTTLLVIIIVWIISNIV